MTSKEAGINREQRENKHAKRLKNMYIYTTKSKACIIMNM
jgi:hypothetical protein